MYRTFLSLVLACGLVSSAAAGNDDFARERKAGETVKDSLEGKPPPALQVAGWMNTGGQALELKALRGKVVLLDFWGVW
jgi:hypothetical protein